MERKKPAKHTLNIAGPLIRKLRSKEGITQDMLAARCNILGLNISRSTIAKIEMQIRCCTDQELVVLAQALKIKMRDFFPNYGKLF